MQNWAGLQNVCCLVATGHMWLIKHLKCGRSRFRYAVSVKQTLAFEDLESKKEHKIPY